MKKGVLKKRRGGQRCLKPRRGSYWGEEWALGQLRDKCPPPCPWALWWATEMLAPWELWLQAPQSRTQSKALGRRRRNKYPPYPEDCPHPLDVSTCRSANHYRACLIRRHTEPLPKAGFTDRLTREARIWRMQNHELPIFDLEHHQT